MGIRCGTNVQINRTVEFFAPERIVLGSHVRIDCFCVISAAEPLTIGSHVHLATGVCLFGSYGLEIGDFVGLSNRVSIFTASDDFADGFLTNPTVPESYKKVRRGRVILRPHVIVGSGSVILPGVTLERGVAVGALSLVNKSVPEFLIVSGQPVRRIGIRNRQRLDALEQDFLSSRSPSS